MWSTEWQLVKPSHETSRCVVHHLCQKGHGNPREYDKGHPETDSTVLPPQAKNGEFLVPRIPIPCHWFTSVWTTWELDQKAVAPIPPFPCPRRRRCVDRPRQEELRAAMCPAPCGRPSPSTGGGGGRQLARLSRRSPHLLRTPRALTVAAHD
jgi:hypothetical protein